MWMLALIVLLALGFGFRHFLIFLAVILACAYVAELVQG